MCLRLTARTCAATPGTSAGRFSLRLLLGAGDGIRLSEHIDGDGALAFQHACRMGLEGIVAKRRDRPNRSGRTADWIKVKNPDAPAAARLIE
jgi:ATP-dependent DNA ligase